MSKYLLNSEQKRAVKYNQGPLLIIAGAGTGKTSVIVEKIKYLIKKKLARPEEILALTFTDKAAFEMEERVDREMPYGYFQMWISTFHAFADQILKQESNHIGISPAYRLMTEAETVIFLRHNLFLFDLKYFRPLGNPNKFLQDLLGHFSRLKDEDIDPIDYLNWAKRLKSKDKTEKEKYLELAHAYRTYQTLKNKENLFDFSDLIYYLLKLFRERKTILKQYQSKFKYVLVDEFQDTNIAQYNLIKLLCPANHNPHLTVVGDDSQAIYKFRGASVSNILNFKKDYQKTKQVSLLKNYRSSQVILDAAYRLIKNNDPDTLEARLGISKKLVAVKTPISIHAANLFISDTVGTEADYVVGEIIKLKNRYQYSDFAILVRANNHADPFIRALSRQNIPYQFLGPATLYKQAEVKDLIAYLKVLNNPTDSISLYRVLTMKTFSVDTKDLIFLSVFAKKTNLSLFQAIEACLDEPGFENYQEFLPVLTKKTKDKIGVIYSMIKKHFQRIRLESAGEILFRFLEETGILTKLTDYKSEKEEKIALNIAKFFTRLKAYEANHEDASVAAAVEDIDMKMELGESPIASQTDISSYNAVNIATTHSAKGLEFGVVFLVNLTRGRFPTIKRSEGIPIPDALIKETLPGGDYHLQEERRLFYVGLTRAIDRVYLTTARFYGEEKREQKISPFVLESLDESAVKKAINLKNEEKEQLSIFDFKKKTEPKTNLPRSFIGVNFSYTQLEIFLRCPLRYKYEYILKLPGPPSPAGSFGDSIHKTLQSYYQEFLKDRKIGQERLLEIYKKIWKPVGYGSAAEENRFRAEGKKMLKNFFQKYHHKNLDILALEKPFKIKISPYINIVGKIDRVDRLPNHSIEIIDYKTGKKPEEKKLAKNLQLPIYTLAATDRGTYNKKLSQVILSLYYLQGPEKISFKITDEQIKKTKERITEIVTAIRNSDFIPPRNHHCILCPSSMAREA
jgi:DNA helicase-2/ATP-dependent DNA helicase PcrA